jgi:hypothetical protein
MMEALHAQRITYAKTKSDAVAKLDGSYMETDKKERQKRNKAERGGDYAHGIHSREWHTHSRKEHGVNTAALRFNGEDGLG